MTSTKRGLIELELARHSRPHTPTALHCHAVTLPHRRCILRSSLLEVTLDAGARMRLETAYALTDVTLIAVTFQDYDATEKAYQERENHATALALRSFDLFESWSHQRCLRLPLLWLL